MPNGAIPEARVKTSLSCYAFNLRGIPNLEFSNNLADYLGQLFLLRVGGLRFHHTYLVRLYLMYALYVFRAWNGWWLVCGRSSRLVGDIGSFSVVVGLGDFVVEYGGTRCVISARGCG
jgi:hypothetical protein